MGKGARTLAVNGGRPVRTKPWGIGPYHSDRDVAALKMMLSGPALPLAGGPKVRQFRECLAKTYGVKPGQVVTASSGTAAIHVALAAAGVGVGDEVIVPPLTDYGSVAGIFQLQAVPVFCDVVEEGIVMDAAKIEACITNRTRAIMPVHNGGYPADIRAIMRLAKRHGIQVVEDCAQAHLARVGKTPVGRFGDFGAFSTNETKHMKSGEGGFIICKRRRDAEYADLFADKCYARGGRGPASPAFPALNVRMSELNAALGLEQLRQLPRWIRRRHQVGTEMTRIIAPYPLVPHVLPRNAYGSYWWFAFCLDPALSIRPEVFCSMLSAEGIPCRNGIQRFLPHWEIFRTLNRQPGAFRTYRPGTLRKGQYPTKLCPQARWAEENIMAVQVNQHVGKSELRDFGRALQKVFSVVYSS